jgi:cysteine desulfuration protein SufE
MTSIEKTEPIQTLIDNFNSFPDWLEKYQYLIELGKRLPAYPVAYQTPEYKIKGCQSNVWLYAKQEGSYIHFDAISDSAIVSGLLYLLLAVYNHKTPHDIAITEPDCIDQIGLRQHLSPTRNNGLAAVLSAIRQYAQSIS